MLTLLGSNVYFRHDFIHMTLVAAVDIISNHVWAQQPEAALSNIFVQSKCVLLLGGMHLIKVKLIDV